VKIVDGAYGTMIERLRANHNPNLFLLNYNWGTFEVLNPHFPYQTKTQAYCYGKIASKAPVVSFAARGWLEEPNG